MLYCDSLGGGPLPAGELTGDDVIVVMSYLASAAEISAAQAAVLEAGAAQVAVPGPLAAPGQLNALGVGRALWRGGHRRGLGDGAVRQRELRALGHGGCGPGAAGIAAEAAGRDGGDQRLRVGVGNGPWQLHAVV